jgi:DUF1707 SHOCT-like domain
VVRPSTVLASDADRDAAAAVLRDNLADGRITMEEFRERLDSVYAARTHGDLDAALAGLRAPAAGTGPAWRPDGAQSGRRARFERRYRRGWGRFVRVNAVVWSLWLAVDLVSAHAVVLFPVLLTLPWAVVRVVYAPRFRGTGRT